MSAPSHGAHGHPVVWEGARPRILASQDTVWGRLPATAPACPNPKLKEALTWVEVLRS